MSPDQQFTATLRNVLGKYPPSSGINLEGMIEDLWHAFEEASIFNHVKVRKTGQPENLLKVLCRCSTLEASGTDVARRLENMWLDNLRYRSGDEAHTVSYSNDAVILSAVTVSSMNGYYVSVRVHVELDRGHE